MELIRKAVEFKADDVDVDSGTFQGHASTFGNVDSDGDVIEKGAFKKTIQESGHRVKVFFEHFNLIGRPMEMREDDHGLFVKGKISKTTLGSDVLTLMRDGALNEMSIGFQIVKEVFDKAANVRRIKELRLWEFSLVPWGANDQALVTGVKSDRIQAAVMEVLKSKEAVSAIKALTKEPPKQTQDPEQIQSLREDVSELSKLL